MANNTTTNKKFNNGFKVYGSKDGKKACDVSIINHTRTNEETNEVSNKGFKVKLEFTDNGFQDKKIIMLEKSELTDLLAVFNGYSKSVECMRNNPVKKLKFENQGTHYFVNFSQEKSKYGIKFSKFDAIKCETLILSALQKNFYEELGVQMTKEEIINVCKNVYGTDTVEIKNSEEVIESMVNKPVEVTNVKKDITNSNEVVCSDCKKPFDTKKEAKIISFSTDKFGMPLCFNCQKTH